MKRRDKNINRSILLVSIVTTKIHTSLSSILSVKTVDQIKKKQNYISKANLYTYSE